MSNTPKFKGNKLKRLEKNPDDEDPVESKDFEYSIEKPYIQLRNCILK